MSGRRTAKEHSIKDQAGAHRVLLPALDRCCCVWRWRQGRQAHARRQAGARARAVRGARYTPHRRTADEQAIHVGVCSLSLQQFTSAWLAAAWAGHWTPASRAVMFGSLAHLAGQNRCHLRAWPRHQDISPARNHSSKAVLQTYRLGAAGASAPPWWLRAGWLRWCCWWCAAATASARPMPPVTITRCCWCCGCGGHRLRL